MQRQDNFPSGIIVKESNLAKMGNSLEVILFQLSLMKQDQKSQPQSSKPHIEVLERNTLQLRDLMFEMRKENQKNQTI